MKKLRVIRNDYITFKEGCNKYLDDRRQRNLREGYVDPFEMKAIKTDKVTSKIPDEYKFILKVQNLLQ